jgi:hypothetical protein
LSENWGRTPLAAITTSAARWPPAVGPSCVRLLLQDIPMNTKAHYSAICFLLASLSLILFISGCEPYQSITFENQISIPIKFDISVVSVDYSGQPNINWNSTHDILNVGETKKYVTSVPDTRRGGINYKYAVVAVSETNEIVFSQIYTWDELNDMDWIIAIK